MLPEALCVSSRKFSAFLLLQIFLLSAAPANAQNVQATSGCAAIPDPASRLACYDAASAGEQKAGKAATRDSHWPEFSSLPRPTSPPTQSPARQIGAVTAAITSYELTPDGRFIVTLDNGQIWRQLAADPGKAQFRERNRVVINRGFWHSYDLKLNSMNAVFKVERVK